MNEEQFLKNFAKLLGKEAEDILKVQEENKVKEVKLLESLNTSLNDLIEKNPDKKSVIEKELPFLKEATPPIPTPGQVALKEPVVLPPTDSVPVAFRKELDNVKELIQNLHKTIARQSSLLAGASHGGGEVRLARLDDVNYSTIADHMYLRYDGATKKFVFDSPLGPGGVQVDWNEANTSGPDYIKNKPLLAMDVNGNISVSANMVPSLNNTSLGSLTQPWQDIYIQSGSINMLPTSNVGSLITLENENDVMTIYSNNGFGFFDNTINNYVFAAKSGGYVNLRTPNPSPGQAVLNISSNPSSNVFPLQNIQTGGVLHASGPNNAISIVTVDTFNNAIGGGVFQHRKFRGTLDAPQAVQLGDGLGLFAAGGFDGNTYVATQSAGVGIQALENFTPGHNGSRVTLFAVPIGSSIPAVVVYAVAGPTQPGLQLAQSGSGIKFFDGSFQSTAFNSNSAVTSVTTGTGLYQTASAGAIGLDATGVLSVAGTARQVLVANVGQNITLSLPQNIDANAVVNFNTLTVQNLNVTGSSTIANNQSLANKQVNLAYNSTSQSQIDQGGITLGNTSQSYAVSLLYSLSANAWTTGNFGFNTNVLNAANVTLTNLQVQGNSNFGGAWAGYDYPNAIIQIDGNVNSYDQVLSQNHNTGTQASTDFVATADNGSDGSNYIDMGINGSNYSNTQWTISGPDDGYLYTSDGNLTIGTAATSKVLKVHIGGTLAQNQVLLVNTTSLAVNGSIFGSTFSGTSNNTNFVGSTSAANVVSNNQLSSNLANYTSNGYASSTFVSNAYATNTFTSNGYASSTFGSNTFNIATFVSNAYATNTFTSNSFITSRFVSNTYATNVYLTNATFNSTITNYAQLAGAAFIGNVSVSTTLTANIINANSATLLNGTNTTPVLMLGTTSIPSPYAVGPTALYTLNQANNNNRIGLDTYSNGMFNVFVGRSARGSTSSPLTTGNNDVILRFSATGYGTSGFSANASARMDFAASENFSDTNKGTQINFWATQPGTNVAVSAAQITYSGVVANNITGNYFVANGTIGTAGYVLISGDGSSNASWQDPNVNNVRIITASNNVTATDGTLIITATTVTLTLPGTAVANGKTYQVMSQTSGNPHGTIAAASPATMSATGVTSLTTPQGFNTFTYYNGVWYGAGTG